MGYVPRFTNDVFISYSHIDNQSVAKDGGWVTQFETMLRIRLSQVVGEGVEIWRDLRLGPADAFSNRIQNAVKDAAILLPVISPGYRKSSWCQRELDAFRAAAPKTGGLQIGDAIRIVKVVKTPLENDEHRSIVPEALGCELYEPNADSGRFQEFATDSAEFAERFEDLVQNLARLLDSMRKRATVYLAQAAPELETRRTKLRQELEARRFRVLPEGPLPPDTAEAMGVIRNALGASSLSVHIINVAEGVFSGPSATADAELQLASEEGLPRVISVGGAGASSAARQPNEASTFDHSDDRTDVLVDKTLESLKEAVFDQLRAPQETVSDSKPSGSEELIRVYLVCDRADHPALQENAASQIRQCLFDAGFEVKLPASDESDPAAIRKDNREKLKQCDAVLIYWQSPSDAWVDERLSEATKALGWRKARAFLAKGVYVTNPKERSKEIYYSLEPNVIIKAWDNPSCDALKPFIERLHPSASSRPQS